MKKIQTLFVMLFLIIGTFSFVLAEDNETANSLEVPTLYSDTGNLDELQLPEPGRISRFENSWDRLRLAFTFNNERKVQRALDFAEERLAEADAIAVEDPERAEKLRQNYETFVEKAQRTMEKMSNSESAKPEDLNESMRELARVQARMETHRERAIIAHEDILERMRENNVSEDKIEKISGLFEKFENTSNALNEKAEEKRNNLETKFRVLSEKSESEMVRLREQINEEEGYAVAQRMREVRDFSRSATEEQFKEKLEQQLQERIENHENLTEEEKLEIRERLDEAADRIKESQGQRPRA